MNLKKNIYLKIQDSFGLGSIGRSSEEYDIVFGKGISWVSSLVEAGIDKGLVEKKGAWFEYKERKEQGTRG